jgi:hypothetical protein
MSARMAFTDSRNCLIYNGKVKNQPGFRFNLQYLDGNDFSGRLVARLSALEL